MVVNDDSEKIGRNCLNWV